MKDRTNWTDLNPVYSTSDSEITQRLVEIERKLEEIELRLNQILATLQ
jgi:hypothetical protein